MTAEPPNAVFSVFAFIGVILVSVPFSWHLEAWNTGTCLYMFWTGLGCLNSFINSIVWNKNVENKAPVWCDISSRIIIAVSVAIPAASLCINRRLYHIATVKSVITTKAMKRRAMMIDLAIGVGIPVLEMILQYIVQGHRFNIFEDIGCFPMTYNTPVSYPLVYCWPVAIGLVSAVYCSLTIRALMKRRSEWNQIFAANNLSSSRHFRLMGLAGVELMLGIPWSIYAALYLNIFAVNGASESPIHPYKSWTYVHLHFSRVGQFPAIEWKQNHTGAVSLELSRWANVICTFLFFAFFGFAQEARKHYRIVFNSIARMVGYTTFVHSGTSTSSRSEPPMASGGSCTIPVFITRETNAKRDSYVSFSTNISLGDTGGTLDESKEMHSTTNLASVSSRNSYEDRPTSTISPSHPPALPPPEINIEVASSHNLH